jgi:hypothetical protein
MTTNPRKYYKNNYNTKKVAPSCNQKMRDQEQSEQKKIQYFPTQVKEMHVRGIIIPAHPAAAQRNFPFL